ncbi:MAG: aminopeptidase P family N-terminal domain-containing protein, partial [Mangrovimonas sp.]|nr:aminopeptidase P family N-terminal domain-containing protein [Mangrovimonas sp.]
MAIKRRDFLNLTTKATVATGLFTTLSACNTSSHSEKQQVISSESNLKNKTDGVKPITVKDRLQRIEKAQNLMIQQGIDALIIDSGTTLNYFTGIYWWPSERTMVAVIPAKGDPFYICPAFEEDRLRENVTIGNKINIWQEDENPFKLIIDSLGISSGNIALEDRLRFFIMDGLRKVA